MHLQVFDKEELQLLLDEYDEDKSGSLDFREFAIMMKGRYAVDG